MNSADQVPLGGGRSAPAALQNDFFRIAGLAQQQPLGLRLGLLDPPAETSQLGLWTMKKRPMMTGTASRIVLAYIQRHAPMSGFSNRIKNPMAVPASPPTA